jgi:hypothetical protein
MSDTSTQEMLAKLVQEINELKAKVNILEAERLDFNATAMVLSPQQMYSRRGLLKYLAASATAATVGAAVIGSSDTAMAQTDKQNDNPDLSSLGLDLPAAPTTPGTRYLTIPGAAFVDSISTNSYLKDFDWGAVSKGANDANNFIAGFTLPQGAVITELIAYFVKPTNISTAFYLKRHDFTTYFDSKNLFFVSNSSSPVSPNLQELSIPIEGGVALGDRTVNNANFAYSVVVAGLPFTSPNNHIFKAFRIGYTVPYAGDLFFLPTPVRVAASTNSGGALGLLTSDGSGNPTLPQTIQITGVGGIPAATRAIVGSLTCVGATIAGNLRLWPTGATAPTVNSLNIPARDGVPLNLTTSFIVGLNAAGQVNLAYSNGTNGSTCGFSIDVAGYLI